MSWDRKEDCGPFDDEIDVYDHEVEKKLIREANERKSALTQLRAALEQMRLAANRINKTTWLWRNDGHN